MSKRRRLEVVDTTEWPHMPAIPIDWSICILCQSNCSETLVCPTLSGYTSLIDSLRKFAEHGALPSSISLEQIDGRSGVLATLTKNSAKYHKRCRNNYDAQKASRLPVSVSVTSDADPQCSGVNTRSSTGSVDVKTSCIFCDGGSVPGNKLVSACTKEIGPKIHAQAVEMQDTRLLSKMSSTDFIALEVKYHKDCYVRFLNSCRGQKRSANASDTDPHRLTYGFVINELVTYMEEKYLYSNTAPVFRLADLTRLVSNRMRDLGVVADEKSINRTRLKEQLLQLVPRLHEDRSGREVILTFEPDISDAIREACEYNDMSDGMCIARAASILRRDMFREFPKFSGSFSGDFCLRDCVPPSLLNFLTTLLGGYNIDNGSPASSAEQTAACSIAQLIRFNCVKRKRLNRPEHTRHHLSHETPLPVYLGLMVHSCTRQNCTLSNCYQSHYYR